MHGGSGRRDALRPAGAGVGEWRRQRLLRVGFDPGKAAAIAADPDYDLHSLIELVERGCPVDLALRILAPLEPSERRAEPC